MCTRRRGGRGIDTDCESLVLRYTNTTSPSRIMKKQLKLAAAGAKADAVISVKNKTRLAKVKLNQTLAKPVSKMHHGEISFSSQNSKTDDFSLKDLSLKELSEAVLSDNELVTHLGSTGARQNQQQKNAKDFPLFTKKLLLPITATAKTSQDPLDPLEQSTRGATAASTTEAVEPASFLGPLSSSSSALGSPVLGRQSIQVLAQGDVLQPALAPQVLLQPSLPIATMAVAMATALPRSPPSSNFTCISDSPIHSKGNTLDQAQGQSTQVLKNVLLSQQTFLSPDVSKPSMESSISLLDPVTGADNSELDPGSKRT